MTEFDKWLDKLDSIQVADKFNNQNRAIARCAWKAALEWVLTKDTGWGGVGISYVINEELNAKT
jgi:hypothetical protein